VGCGKLCPTANNARLRPRRLASLRYCADTYVPFVRRAAHAASTRARFSQRFPLVIRPPRLFPALSSLPGHIPVHDARCPALANGPSGLTLLV
jgi:hypothetical protein